MAKKGRQKGAQRHAEGEHGAKTKARHTEILQSRPVAPPSDAGPAHDDAGQNRLFERREQHDEAELHSEKTRVSRDISRHGHVRENFQVVGGAESHPAMPSSSINPRNPDEPNRSSRLPPDERPDRA